MPREVIGVIGDDIYLFCTHNIQFYLHFCICGKMHINQSQQYTSTFSIAKKLRYTIARNIVNSNVSYLPLLNPDPITSDSKTSPSAPVRKPEYWCTFYYSIPGEG